MRKKLRAVLAAAVIAGTSMLAPMPAGAAGFTAAGSLYQHYGAGGFSKGVFVGGACDALGWNYNVSGIMLNGGAWSHNVSSIHVTGFGGCDGLRVYARDNPSVYWTCPGRTCSGTVVNLAPPFSDNLGRVRYFHVTAVGI